MAAKYNEKDLLEGLEKLTGNDFNHCEMLERRAGNMHADLAFSKSFQARLAARALKEDIGIIKALPVFEYNQLCWTVSNFLQFGSVDLTAKMEELLSSENISDNSPQNSENLDR